MAHTPEELETLLEDGLIIRDPEALVALFDEHAVLVAGNKPALHGPGDIVRSGLEIWNDERGYVADPQCIVQAHDIALLVSERSLNVARRSANGTWRFAIVLVRDDLY